MNRTICSLAFVVATAISAGPTLAQTKDITVPVNAISSEGVGAKIGEIVLSEYSGGVSMKVNITGIPDGDHGFHIHEKGDCGPGDKDGKVQAGIAAGPHMDPKATKTHKGPEGSGHAGDLPKLTAKMKEIKTQVTVTNVKFADLLGKSLMIHEGGDNYSDDPENGGGKGRIACGVVPKG